MVTSPFIVLCLSPLSYLAWLAPSNCLCRPEMTSLKSACLFVLYAGLKVYTSMPILLDVSLYLLYFSVQIFKNSSFALVKVLIPQPSNSLACLLGGLL